VTTSKYFNQSKRAKKLERSGIFKYQTSTFSLLTFFLTQIFKCGIDIFWLVCVDDIMVKSICRANGLVELKNSQNLWMSQPMPIKKCCVKVSLAQVRWGTANILFLWRLIIPSKKFKKCTGKHLYLLNISVCNLIERKKSFICNQVVTQQT